MTMVRQAGLAATPQASMAFTALGQAQAADGDTADALATLDEGLGLRRIGPDVGPWGTIHHLMTTARVYAGAGRLADARQLMAELAERMARFGASMDSMWARYAAIEEAIRELRDADGPVEALTARELDVLRLLQGSLSLGEISDVLHLSANTVKTHAQAVYRKLGAHSRTEAVRLARLHQLV